MEPIYSETYLDAIAPKSIHQKRVTMIIICIVLTMFVIFCLSGGIQVLGLFLVIIVDGILIYMLPTTKIAYEYVFVDGQIDFDCILAGNGRKNICKVDMDHVDIIAPEGSGELKSVSNYPLKDVCSGKEEDKHYILVARGDDGTTFRVKFTPDQILLDNIKTKTRSKLKEY